MTEKIDHAAESRKHIEDVTAYENDAHSFRFNGEHERAAAALAHAGISVQQAQAHATLALVEQQRVANMIALARPEVIDEVHDTKVWLPSWIVERDEAGNITRVELRPEIASPLGLEDVQIEDGDD